MAQEIDRFLPKVTMYVAGASELLVYELLREAARELCERTKVWREHDEFEVTDPDYEGIPTLEDAEIVSIEAARLDGEPLEPVTVQWLDANVEDWRDLEDTPARYVTQLQPNSVRIVPMATGMLKARMVLKPSIDALSLPDFLFYQYASELGRAAAGRALLIPGKPFTNPQLGSSLLSEWSTRLDTLSTKTTRGQHRAPIRTKASWL